MIITITTITSPPSSPSSPSADRGSLLRSALCTVHRPDSSGLDDNHLQVAVIFWGRWMEEGRLPHLPFQLPRLGQGPHLGPHLARILARERRGQLQPHPHSPTFSLTCTRYAGHKHSSLKFARQWPNRRLLNNSAVEKSHHPPPKKKTQKQTKTKIPKAKYALAPRDWLEAGPGRQSAGHATSRRAEPWAQCRGCHRSLREKMAFASTSSSAPRPPPPDPHALHHPDTLVFLELRLRWKSFCCLSTQTATMIPPSAFGFPFFTGDSLPSPLHEPTVDLITDQPVEWARLSFE